MLKDIDIKIVLNNNFLNMPNFTPIKETLYTFKNDIYKNDSVIINDEQFKKIEAQVMNKGFEITEKKIVVESYVDIDLTPKESEYPVGNNTTFSFIIEKHKTPDRPYILITVDYKEDVKNAILIPFKELDNLLKIQKEEATALYESHLQASQKLNELQKYESIRKEFEDLKENL